MRKPTNTRNDKKLNTVYTFNTVVEIKREVIKWIKLCRNLPTLKIIKILIEHSTDSIIL